MRHQHLEPVKVGIGSGQLAIAIAVPDRAERGEPEICSVFVHFV
jgi:hypothetical protein